MELIKTKQEAWKCKDLDEILTEIKKRKYTYCVIYRADKVETLKTEDVEDLNDLLEIRAFNSNGELRAISSGDEFIGRIRTDEEGAETEYLDESHLLWGTRTEQNGTTKNGYTFLQEDRGTKLTVPIEVKENQRAFVKVRNYLSSAKDKFELVDFRMVELFAQEAKEYV